MIDLRERLPTAIVACALMTVALGAAAVARAQDDYDPRSRAWNGLSDLMALGDSASVRIEAPERLDLDSLTPSDALLILYPTDAMPLGSLAAFMKEGGRVAIADDFGEAQPLLGLYRIRRRQTAAPEAPRLRGNDALLVAKPLLRHVLTDGVTALVTNHPTALHHHDLEPLLAFDESGEGVVLAGAVDAGRLVAIGDPSVLINNMLQFRDNRRFAENLLRYLDGDRGGRLVVVVGDTPIVGRYGDREEGQPLADARRWLEDVASADLPPLALRLFAIVIAAVLLVVAASSLPRKSPYDGRAMAGRAGRPGGFAGRVAFFRERHDQLLHPLLVYKFELEGELLRRAGLGERTLLRDVLERLRKNGMPEPDVAEMRALLLELDRLHRVQDHPTGAPRVQPRRFHQMIEAGERILARLGSP